MDGLYLNEIESKKIIELWISSIILSKNSWEANNLHIDEIITCNEITKSEWIDLSFKIVELMTEKIKILDPLLLFLHIDLKYSSRVLSLNELSLNWLKKNVSEFTPPSLNFTSLEYFNEFYNNELISCKPDKCILNILPHLLNANFFYRTYFDYSENKFSREIYIFFGWQIPNGMHAFQKNSKK